MKKKSILRTLKVTPGENKRLKVLADRYTKGNISELLRLAALNYKKRGSR